MILAVLGGEMMTDRLDTTGSRRAMLEPASTMPVIFVAHGSPELATDQARGEPFVKWGSALPRPRAILVISAHWEKSRPVSLSSTNPRELVYDFGGFPRALYEVRYDAPGAGDLATRIESLLPANTVARTVRGLDHGAWTPLVHLYPQADVPVLQISMPSSEGPNGLFEFGRKLAPLRDEGVLIMGSGNITHPMLELRMGFPAETPSWAKDFDEWAATAIRNRNYDSLIDYAAQAPAVRRNNPTADHYLPLLVVAGAASVKDSKPNFVLEEFEYNLFSRRSIEFGG
jgi:4,5-DOPA dioxygenase extradiol